MTPYLIEPSPTAGSVTLSRSLLTASDRADVELGSPVSAQLRG